MNQDHYTVGKLFEETDCISKEMLLLYADGKLSKAAGRKVEMHLIDCELCNLALEGVQAAGTKAFDDMLDNVSERILAYHKPQTEADEDDNVIQFRPTINPPAAARSTKRFLPFISIAASVAILAVLGIFFLGGGNAGSVADDYFQQHSISDTRSVMNGTPTAPVSAEDEKLASAQAAYDSKDFKAAAPLFDKVGTAAATFQAGNCYYMSAQYAVALERYQSVIATPTMWKEYAEMNLAMTYLKLDRVPDAKLALERIVAKPTHNFFKQATDALKDVNGL
jgi:hypothetical protein